MNCGVTFPLGGDVPNLRWTFPELFPVICWLIYLYDYLWCCYVAGGCRLLTLHTFPTLLPLIRFPLFPIVTLRFVAITPVTLVAGARCVVVVRWLDPIDVNCPLVLQPPCLLLRVTLVAVIYVVDYYPYVVVRHLPVAPSPHVPGYYRYGCW